MPCGKVVTIFLVDDELPLNWKPRSRPTGLPRWVVLRAAVIAGLYGAMSQLVVVKSPPGDPIVTELPIVDFSVALSVWLLHCDGLIMNGLSSAVLPGVP